jgi:hypothetical protein
MEMGMATYERMTVDRIATTATAGRNAASATRLETRVIEIWVYTWTREAKSERRTRIIGGNADKTATSQIPPHHTKYRVL